jgi:hypothetical protein
VQSAQLPRQAMSPQLVAWVAAMIIQSALLGRQMYTVRAVSAALHTQGAACACANTRVSGASSGFHRPTLCLNACHALSTLLLVDCMSH